LDENSTNHIHLLAFLVFCSTYAFVAVRSQGARQRWSDRGQLSHYLGDLIGFERNAEFLTVGWGVNFRGDGFLSVEGKEFRL
jgi:hypothetical protein